MQQQSGDPGQANGLPVLAGSGQTRPGGARQFVSFRVGPEGYAVDIMAVREIRGWTKTTCLPNMPPFVLGVLNLPGAVVPVYDLGALFGRSAIHATYIHVILIVAVGSRVVGMLADGVSDILTVHSGEIRDVPDMDGGTGSCFVAGLIPSGSAMVVLLSLEQLFANELQAAAACDAA